MATSATTAASTNGSMIRMGNTMSNRAPLRYQNSVNLLDAASAEFRLSVLGLGKRLTLKGVADMLAGKRECPHAFSVRYLVGLHDAGLGREAAERYILWQQVAAAHIWRADRTPLHVLEEREQDAENVANIAYVRCKHANTPENRRKLYEARLAEAAAEMACLSHPDAQ